jgi:hypothetical protein
MATRPIEFDHQEAMEYMLEKINAAVESLKNNKNSQAIADIQETQRVFRIRLDEMSKQRQEHLTYVAINCRNLALTIPGMKGPPINMIATHSLLGGGNDQEKLNTKKTKSQYSRIKGSMSSLAQPKQDTLKPEPMDFSLAPPPLKTLPPENDVYAEEEEAEQEEEEEIGVQEAEEEDDDDDGLGDLLQDAFET